MDPPPQPKIASTHRKMKAQTAKTDLFMGDTSLQRIHHFALMSFVDSFVVTSGTV